MKFMTMKRIPLFLDLLMLRDLMKLAAKIGSNRGGAIRYCIARTLIEEGIRPGK
jgi:hypothetical protein